MNYVSDICNGFIALAKCDEAVGKEINIGSGTNISMGNLANLFIELTGLQVKIVSENERKRPEKDELIANCMEFKARVFADKVE